MFFLVCRWKPAHYEASLVAKRHAAIEHEEEEVERDEAWDG